MKILIILSVVLCALLTGQALFSHTGKKVYFPISLLVICSLPGAFSIQGAPLLFLSIPVWLYLRFKHHDSLMLSIILPGISVSFAASFDLRLLLLGTFFIPAILFSAARSAGEKVRRIVFFLAAIVGGMVILFPVSVYIAYPYKIILPLAAPGASISIIRLAAIILLALPGVMAFFRQSRETAATLLTFPVIYLLIATIDQNAPLIFPAFFMGVFSIATLVSMFEYIEQKLHSGNRSRSFYPRLIPTMAIILAAALLLPLIPNITALRGWISDKQAQALNQITTVIPAGSDIVTTDFMAADIPSLADKYRVTIYPAKEISHSHIRALDAVLHSPYYIIPDFTAYSADPSFQRTAREWNLFRTELDACLNVPGTPAFLDYYYLNPLESPGFVAGKRRRGNMPPAALTIFNPWKRSIGKYRGLTTFSSIGEFELSAIEEAKKTISIRSVKPDANNWRKIAVGYLLGDAKFPFPVPSGNHLFMTVDIAIQNPNRLTHCDLVIRERDASNTWDTLTVPVQLAFRNTAVISKVISPTSRFVLAGIIFNPSSDQEILFIRGVRLSVAPPQSF